MSTTRGAIRRLRAAGRVLAGPGAPPDQHAAPWDDKSDMEAAFWDDHKRAEQFTMTSCERMYATWQAARYVAAANISGDVVECGVWRGGSAMIAALALQGIGDSRPVWLYDTFEGMPPPSDRDVQFDGQAAAAKLAVQPRVAGGFNDWAFATLADVQAQMSSVGHDARFVVGPVEQTIPAEVPEAISLLRLDTDWYESTKHELEHLWPLLSPGGVLIVDDYGHWQGARQAVDEFFEREGPVLLNRSDYTGRIVIKVPRN